MQFKIGQKFSKEYPPESAVWCNNNNAHLEKINNKYVIVQNQVKQKSEAEILKEYENTVQKYIDETAQERGYDNSYTCLSYMNSTNETWKNESNIFNVWRDNVWLTCHEILNKFLNNEIEQPTKEDIINQLPKIEW